MSLRLDAHKDRIEMLTKVVNDCRKALKKGEKQLESLGTETSTLSRHIDMCTCRIDDELTNLKVIKERISRLEEEQAQVLSNGHVSGETNNVAETVKLFSTPPISPAEGITALRQCEQLKLQVGPTPKPIFAFPARPHVISLPFSLDWITDGRDRGLQARQPRHNTAPGTYIQNGREG